MREETRKRVVYCAHCQLPIKREQRPSVRIREGVEVHAECYQKYEEAERNKGS